MNSVLSDNIAHLARLVLSSRRLVVFTGAGVRTESGIADFLRPGGLWERYDPDDFTIRKFLHNPDTRKKIWRMMATEFLVDVQPNRTHVSERISLKRYQDSINTGESRSQDETLNSGLTIKGGGGLTLRNASPLSNPIFDGRYKISVAPKSLSVCPIIMDFPDFCSTL